MFHLLIQILPLIPQTQSPLSMTLLLLPTQSTPPKATVNNPPLPSPSLISTVALHPCYTSIPQASPLFETPIQQITNIASQFRDAVTSINLRPHSLLSHAPRPCSSVNLQFPLLTETPSSSLYTLHNHPPCPTKSTNSEPPQTPENLDSNKSSWFGGMFGGAKEEEKNAGGGSDVKILESFDAPPVPNFKYK